MFGSSLTSSCSAGMASNTGAKASRRSARRSQSSSPEGGTTLKASPERRIVGTAVSRSGPVGVAAGGHELSHRRERQQSAAALLRGRAGVRRTPVSEHAERRGGLALHDHPLRARLRALARLEAETRVEAGEALGMSEGGGAPLLVVHQQHHRLGEQLGARRQLAHHAQRERHAALHVHRPGPGEAVDVIARQRTVGVVRDNSVEVPEQHQPALAASRSRPTRSRA